MNENQSPVEEKLALSDDIKNKLVDLSTSLRQADNRVTTLKSHLFGEGIKVKDEQDKDEPEPSLTEVVDNSYEDMNHYIENIIQFLNRL